MKTIKKRLLIEGIEQRLQKDEQLNGIAILKKDNRYSRFELHYKGFPIGVITILKKDITIENYEQTGYATNAEYEYDYITHLFIIFIKKYGCIQHINALKEREELQELLQKSNDQKTIKRL